MREAEGDGSLRPGSPRGPPRTSGPGALRPCSGVAPAPGRPAAHDRPAAECGHGTPGSPPSAAPPASSSRGGSWHRPRCGGRPLGNLSQLRERQRRPLWKRGAGGEGALAWARHPSVRAPPHCAGPAFLREPRSRPSLPHPAHGLDQEANDQGAASVGSVVSPLSPPRIHCSSCFYPATEFFKAASGPRAWDQV